jgi:starvation-inducible DNA-binding protein
MALQAPNPFGEDEGTGELRQAEKTPFLRMRAMGSLCDDAGDAASASLLENWLDEFQLRG